MKLPKLSPATDRRTFQATAPFTRSAIHTAGSGGGVPTPAPGCVFVGTECRGFFQSCKYCCGDGRSYTQSCGSCVGWYDAPPCLGF